MGSRFEEFKGQSLPLCMCHARRNLGRFEIEDEYVSGTVSGLCHQRGARWAGSEEVEVWHTFALVESKGCQDQDGWWEWTATLCVTRPGCHQVIE